MEGNNSEIVWFTNFLVDVSRSVTLDVGKTFDDMGSNSMGFAATVVGKDDLTLGTSSAAVVFAFTLCCTSVVLNSSASPPVSSSLLDGVNAGLCDLNFVVARYLAF